LTIFHRVDTYSIPHNHLSDLLGLNLSLMLVVLGISKVNLLLDSGGGLLVELVVLEEESKFLQGATAGLGVEPVDNAELKANPTTVDGKVLPLDGIESNGVDVGGEETGELSEDLLDTDTTGSHGIWPKFDQVGVGKGVVSNVVGRRVSKVKEQRGDTSGVVLLAHGSSLDLLERDSNGDECEKHERGRKHVHVSTLETRDDKSNDCGVDQTPASVGKIDACLCPVVGKSHEFEELGRVVAHKSVAGKLGEETDEDGDDKSATHTGGADNLEPGLLGSLHLSLDGLTDLYDFGLDELGVPVALGVVLDENFGGLFGAVLGDEETRRFGQEENSGDLDQRWADLKERRNSPCPVGRDRGGTHGNGRGGDLTNEVGRVEKRGQSSTLLGVTQLSDEGGTRNDTEENSGSENHTSNDVHANVLGESLNKSTNNHDERTKHDGPSSAVLLSKPGCKWDSKDGTELVARVDKTEHTGFDGIFAFVVHSSATEIVMEGLRVLQSVDELRIETRGHLNTHTTKEQPDVEHTKIGLLVPWHLILIDEAGDDGIGGSTNVDHRDGLGIDS
jgi:hypothetical protein